MEGTVTLIDALGGGAYLLLLPSPFTQRGVAGKSDAGARPGNEATGGLLVGCGSLRFLAWGRIWWWKRSNRRMGLCCEAIAARWGVLAVWWGKAQGEGGDYWWGGRSVPVAR